MADGVQRFEDLIAWRKARALACTVFEITRRQPFAEDEELRRQMRAAATSIMSNIAEGFERFGAREFSRFLLVAKASCAEVRSLTYLAHDIGYLGPAASDRLMSQAEECARIVGGLCASLRARCATR